MYVNKLIQSSLVTNTNIRLLSKKSEILSYTISRCACTHTHTHTNTGKKCEDKKDEIEVKDKKNPFFLTQHCSVAIDTDASLGCQSRMKWRQRNMEALSLSV